MSLDVLKQFRPPLVRNTTPLHHLYNAPKSMRFSSFLLTVVLVRLQTSAMATSNPLTKSDVSLTEHGVGYKKDCRIIHSITPKLCQKILLVSLSTKPSVSTVASVFSCQRCSPLFPIFSRKQKRPFPL